MAQTDSPKVAEIIREMANIFAIPLSAADRIVHNALDNGQFVIALPFSPDASLLQVEAIGGVSTPRMYGSGKSGVALTAGTGLTLLTPTAGKTLYITSIHVSVNFGGALSFELRDGGSGGSVVYSWMNLGSGTEIPQSWQLTFPTPLKFSTDMWLDSSNNNTLFIGAQGYEA